MAYGSTIGGGSGDTPRRAASPGIPAGFSAVAPVERTTMHAALVSRIRDMIVEGTLDAGSRVHEGQLGTALGVSRTPLREALKFLASEGLIDLVPGRGAVVRRMTAQDVRDMLTVLSTLEILAARLACEVAQDAEIAAIRVVHDEMMDHYRRGERLEYYRRNQAIHRAIVAASGNVFLAETHEGIQSRLRRIRYIGHGGSEKWRGAVDEHEEMIAALEARDAERLAEVVERHLRHTWERVQHSL